ncbi:hypothetical protein HTE05_23370 [Serratia marcescens]|uniref:phage tail fiber protein n=1 Tax=Serratia marcescens TaxID=615 RepID=UPI00156E1B13|nr:hypothetical protein [Serratia marcescens]NSL16548.1 hypothetical protein [Serratia marcescens]
MWYRVGKINVTLNSAVVTGVGTMWADAKNGVMPGMTFIAPDNKLYEVKQVVSNTSLTLSSNYTGATASGQVYAIITTYEGDITQFSARFSALLTYFQGSRSELIDVLTSDGDVKLTKEDGAIITVPSYPKLVGGIDDRIISTTWGKTHYPMPSQGTGKQWYKLGTVTTDQHGDSILFEFIGGYGYNGTSNQAGIQQLLFRYGNRQAGTNINGAASITLFTLGDRVMVSSAAMIEASRNTFDIYILIGPFITPATYMTVDSRSSGQLAKINVSLQKTDVAPAGTMDFIEYKIPIWNTKEPMPDYSVVASPSLNGFGTGPQHKDDLFSSGNLSSINRFTASSINVPGATLGACLALPMDGGPTCGYLAITSGRGLWVGSSNTVTNKTILWNRVWSEINTTIDSNGFIKKASPIVKLFGDGTAGLNAESQGVTTERISTGVYRISGTLGLNADAEWGGAEGGIEIPLDINKRAKIWVDYKVLANGDIELRTYHREHQSGPTFARNIIEGVSDGDPIDIPDGRWVDLRVEMPEVEPVIDPDDVNADEQPTEPERETSDPGLGLMEDDTEQP